MCAQYVMNQVTQPHSHLFSAKLYYSSLRLGRPNIRDVLEGAGCDASNAYVMACGPESLQLSASEAAMEIGCKFHQETFHF